MGRSVKEGLDYFDFDVVLDEKFELIEAEFGLSGFAVVVKLFQRIYGQRGYYCEWNDEVALVFARAVGMGANAVSEIVRASIKRGIFCKDMFERFSILTSNGIQKRYFNAVKRRNDVKVEERYLLVSLDPQIISASINRISVNINRINVNRNPQSRVDSMYVGKDTTTYLPTYIPTGEIDVDINPINVDRKAISVDINPDCGESANNNPVSVRTNGISADINPENVSRNKRGAKKDEEAQETTFGNVMVDKGWQRVVECYQNNIGSMPMGLKLDKIQSLYDDLGEELTLYAIELTNDRQPKVPPNYLIGIMEKWLELKVTTLSQARALVNDRKRSMTTNTQTPTALKEPKSPFENPFEEYLNLGGTVHGTERNEPDSGV